MLASGNGHPEQEDGLQHIKMWVPVRGLVHKDKKCSKAGESPNGYYTGGRTYISIHGCQEKSWGVRADSEKKDDETRLGHGWSRNQSRAEKHARKRVGPGRMVGDRGCREE